VPRDSREPLEAGRNRYDTATWRRISDSFVWRWVVGPIVYGTLVAALAVLGVDGGLIAAFVAGTLVAYVILAVRTRDERRRNRVDIG
jgi:hypothetical protein